jgi:ABC-type Fe3+-hydroxamate transport system substrate-binding protein
LADLSLDDRVVGITRFCERPKAWHASKPFVGGTKNVNVDAVRELDPDLVLANHEENVRADVEAIDAFAPTFVTDVRNVEDACRMIRVVGRLTHTTDCARELSARIEEQMEALEVSTPKRAVYLIWRDPFMTVGGDTFIHDVMTRGGFVNPFGDHTRYPEVSLETIVDAEPDVVLCSSEPFPFHQKDRFTADLRDAMGATPVRIVDGQVFSWYGSRLLSTSRALRRLHASLGSRTLFSPDG